MCGTGFVFIMALIWWGPPVSLGLRHGRRAQTPARAFLRGLASAYFAAELLPAVMGVILFSASPHWPPWLVVGMLVFGLPPAILAGTIAAVFRVRGQPSRISPDVEAAARSRFTPSRRQADTDAIQPANKGVREENCD